MTDTPDRGLPLDLGVDIPDGAALRARSRFRKRCLLVLLIPVFMFTGAVLGLYFQARALQKFYPRVRGGIEKRRPLRASCGDPGEIRSVRVMAL